MLSKQIKSGDYIKIRGKCTSIKDHPIISCKGIVDTVCPKEEDRCFKVWPDNTLNETEGLTEDDLFRGKLWFNMEGNEELVILETDCDLCYDGYIGGHYDPSSGKMRGGKVCTKCNETGRLKLNKGD